MCSDISNGQRKLQKAKYDPYGYRGQLSIHKFWKRSEQTSENCIYYPLRGNSGNQKANRVDLSTLLKSCYSTPLFYVANATVCFANAETLPIIDRNIVRLYRGVFGEEFPETEHDQERFAADLLLGDGDTARTFNMVLLKFGATVCTKSIHLFDTYFANEYYA